MIGIWDIETIDIWNIETKEATFDDLTGKTITSIDMLGNKQQMVFKTNDGKTYLMHHYQDCCEMVYIEDIAGDLKDVIGYPVLLAETVSNTNWPSNAHFEKYKYTESYTWTFYKLATIWGGITIRWYGESNGYYSESVDFVEIVE
jgi:hypothetical protein